MLGLEIAVAAQNDVEAFTLLCNDEETMPVFNIFSRPDSALLTSIASLHPAVLRRNPNSASIGSLENFRVSTKMNYFFIEQEPDAHYI